MGQQKSIHFYEGKLFTSTNLLFFHRFSSVYAGPKRSVHFLLVFWWVYYNWTGWFHSLFSPRKLGKISNLTCAYFSDGWLNHQPVVWPDWADEHFPTWELFGALDPQDFATANEQMIGCLLGNPSIWIYLFATFCNLPTSNQKTDTRSGVLKIFNLHLPSSPCQPLEAHEHHSISFLQRSTFTFLKITAPHTIQWDDLYIYLHFHGLFLWLFHIGKYRNRPMGNSFAGRPRWMLRNKP